MVPSTMPICAGVQLGPLGGGERVGWGEVDDVRSPLANDLRVSDRARSTAEDAEPTVADLVAVAVRAVQHVAGPPVAEPRDVGQLVPQAGRDEQPSRRDRLPARRAEPGSRSGRRPQGQ